MTLPGGFQLKRIFLAGGLAVFALSIAPGVAAAQAGGLRLPEGSASRPVVRGTTRSEPVPVEPAYPVYPSYPAYPVAVTYIPAIIMSDGSVYANFGTGYFPVRRACPTRSARVLDGRGMRTERYRQPAPAQRSASAEALPHVQEQRRREMELAARSACYTRNAYGGIVVVR